MRISKHLEYCFHCMWMMWMTVIGYKVFGCGSSEIEQSEINYCCVVWIVLFYSLYIVLILMKSAKIIDIHRAATYTWLKVHEWLLTIYKFNWSRITFLWHDWYVTIDLLALTYFNLWIFIHLTLYSSRLISRGICIEFHHEEYQL